jgi:hypothetical protein
MIMSLSEEFSLIKAWTSASTATVFSNLHDLPNAMITDKVVQKYWGIVNHSSPSAISSGGHTNLIASSACPIHDFPLFNLLPFGVFIAWVITVHADSKVGAGPAVLNSILHIREIKEVKKLPIRTQAVFSRII